MGRIAAAVFTVAAVVAAITLGPAAFRLTGLTSCSDPVRLSVAVAPDLGKALTAIAAEWTKTTPRVEGRCVTVEVGTAEPAEVAATIAGQHNVALAGVGRAGAAAKAPQVWIPDSTSWLTRLRAAKTDALPVEAPSIASSPVVLAAAEPRLAALGSGGMKPTWADLLQRVTSDSRLRNGIVEPGRDAAGLSALVAMRAASPNPQAAIGLLRALYQGRSVIREDLLNRYPRATDPATMASGLGLAPVSEAAVVAYNTGSPPVPLGALYPQPAAGALDFPYVALPRLDPEVAKAAADFRGYLAGSRAKELLAEHGLRTPAGVAETGFPTGRGVVADVAPPATPLPVTTIDQTLSTWNTVTLPGRMLAVVDVSGSMSAPVPTAGNATRSQVTVEAARRGLALFDDTWAIGLWVFSTELDGAKDHRQLVPVGPMSSQRTALLSAFGTIAPKPDGATGLYDTILAAYRDALAGWEPGRVNSVVLFTDGRNEDQNGISLDALVAELAKIKDPNRPIQVIALGIGPDVGSAELERITKTTGGGVFVAQDPAKIGEIFLRAISLRGGQ